MVVTRVSVRAARKTPRMAEMINNFEKLLKNSNKPLRPYLFLAFEMGDSRFNLGSSLEGATTKACCAMTVSNVTTAGTKNHGRIDQTTDDPIRPVVTDGFDPNSSKAISGENSSTARN